MNLKSHGFASDNISVGNIFRKSVQKTLFFFCEEESTAAVPGGGGTRRFAFLTPPAKPKLNPNHVFLRGNAHHAAPGKWPGGKGRRPDRY